MSNQCFHCNDPIPSGIDLNVEINGKPEPMCCIGCHGVASAIVENGLIDYYTYRSEPGNNQQVIDQLNDLQSFDLEEIQQEFVHLEGDTSETLISIEGITCSACAWLIESKLRRLPGLIHINVNATTSRATIKWQQQQLPLSEILGQIQAIGYQAAPFVMDGNEQQDNKKSKQFLLRVGLAGFATMQVMMFALALYAGFFTDLEQQYRDYFRWVSLLFATPVVLYSAQPFYFSAVRAAMNKQVNMDTPVSIAILIAFGSSCYATFTGIGEVYFESVSMFTFFLLMGRYFEQKARQRASEHASNLHKLIPLSAHLVTPEGLTMVAAKKLKVGDRISIASGETIAADGVIVEGNSAVDEAMLTGESIPVSKLMGDEVYAGTLNTQHPIIIEITKVGQDQLVSEIIRLQHQATIAKPKIAEVADTVAKYFVPAILLLSTLTYIVWLQIAPEDAFWIALSVLVASCPCALSLATPTAITVGTLRLQKIGLLSKRSDVFERLVQIKNVIFDKTGTLTQGQISLNQTHTLDDNYQAQQVIDIAAALEQGSKHPIAKAFITAAEQTVTANNIEHHQGAGVSGIIAGKLWRLGNSSFTEQSAQDGQCVYLSCEGRAVAYFELHDPLRSDARATCDLLSQKGMNIVMASGDQQQTVDKVANELGIKQAHGELDPFAKLELLKTINNNNTAMFGDGINDAPVLASSHLSIAMVSGSMLVKSKADLVLTNDKLGAIVQAFGLAKATRAIMHQNLFWSLAYNAFIIPLAMLGMVAPYWAALGMSLSSVLVVSNSLRLNKLKL
ncbi:heavy metal translocating P-type ATPase [Paraferrimonas sp. SM1919]|uniref:heavy metal translocating P-type ATPase n=1 Tax=Paraferrimonas sp. SM1919 TaxID=2662263 RepID=UPI0013D40FA5|nr:heavy metal translocating P-type ATPase [Paraferrimonas sp. SM1919]